MAEIWLKTSIHQFFQTMLECALVARARVFELVDMNCKVRYMSVCRDVGLARMCMLALGAIFGKCLLLV